MVFLPLLLLCVILLLYVVSHFCFVDTVCGVTTEYLDPMYYDHTLVRCFTTYEYEFAYIPVMHFCCCCSVVCCYTAVAAGAAASCCCSCWTYSHHCQTADTKPPKGSWNGEFRGSCICVGWISTTRLALWVLICPTNIILFYG